jgi:hypothetical protein
MRCNLVLKSLLLLSILLIAVAVLAAPAANDQSTLNSVNPLRTYLQPDLTLKSVLSPELLPPAQRRVLQDLPLQLRLSLQDQR